MIKIRCVVERITYQNPENGYSVLKVAVKGYDDLVPLVGNLLDAAVGSVLLVEGNWKMNHFVMLQRNLIYTGITRAKKILVLVGTRRALAYAVKNVTVTRRNTLLKERLAGEAAAGMRYTMQ